MAGKCRQCSGDLERRREFTSHAGGCFVSYRCIVCGATGVVKTNLPGRRGHVQVGQAFQGTTHA